MTKQRILITGSGRGIGLEFVKHYLRQGAKVYAGYRDEKALANLQALNAPDLQPIKLDITNANDVNACFRQLQDQGLDLLIQNAGIYGPKGYQLGEINEQQWQQVMQVNTLAPVKLIETLWPLLKSSKHGKIVALSSKMGSIADNGSGGSYIYRSSKAALNACLKSLAIDLAEQGISVGILHPGWVQTDMGGPNALIDAHESVSGLTQVIASLTMQTSGNFYNYNGDVIPW